ncbi:MAG: M28 family peptidase [Candidatus Hermodarchaeota archaeon]
MIRVARIKKNLKEFAFPRLSGTGFELKAFNKVKREVENLNLDYEIQRFTFSSFYSRLYPKLAFSSASLIFLILLLFLNAFMIFSLVLILILLGIIITSFILTRTPEKIKINSKLISQNLLVKIKSNQNKIENSDRIALFMSHLDSKGQRFTVRIRIRIVKLYIASTVILPFFIILRNLQFLGLEIIFLILGLIPLILNIFAATIIVLNKTDNSSMGAVDNASGIACNLELLNYYSNPENRLKNYDMWFLFSGAEECGTMGIRHFYNNLKNFDSEKSVIFNFESIANFIFLFPGDNEGSHLKDIDFLLLNNKRRLPIRHYITSRVLGTHSDGGFLGDRGFQGFGIGEVQAYDYMHTPKDTIDKVNTVILKKLCLVLTDTLKDHDSNFTF